MPLLPSVRSDETGATLVEYGFVVLFVALAAIGAVRLFGLDVRAMFEAVAEFLP